MSGTIPVEIDSLNILVKGFARVSLAILIILFGISIWALLTFRFAKREDTCWRVTTRGWRV